MYSSALHTEEAVETAFEAATSENRILEEAASILHRHIQAAYSNSQETLWPPSANFFNSGVISPPRSLVDFLSLIFYLTFGIKTSRLSQSIAKDICVTVTRGRWKVPKHLLLSMTLRHWPSSADLITLLNRYGHCQSYSMTVVLETAIAN